MNERCAKLCLPLTFLALIGTAACGTGVETDFADDGYFSCDQADFNADDGSPEDKPCEHEGEVCSWGWECISCQHTCQGGKWIGECSNIGLDCPAEPPAPGSMCSGFCGVPLCDYSVSTPCGSETVEATCGTIGWSYASSCDTRCADYADVAACGTDPSCVWLGRCDGGASQCVDNAPCPSEGCPDGQMCTELSYNPCDPVATECDSCGALVEVCVMP